MKNELRKQTPLSIALHADPIQTLAEIEERGLAPQLFANFFPLTPPIAQTAIHLHSLGALLIDFQAGSPPPSGFESSQSLIAPLIQDRHWILQTFTFETPAALRDFDARALALLTPADTLRRNWLSAAARILPRERPLRRVLWLTESEKQAFST
jgi:hypothetical protein